MEQKVDRDSYNKYYRKNLSKMAEVKGMEEFVKVFERKILSPFYKGGTTKGFVKGLSVKLLLEEAEKLNRPFNKINILDTGCGRGELSVYLACKGFNVTGVDISEEACICGDQLAVAIGVADHCTFIAESLENISSVPDNSIDLIIGHAALHHFIKYNVPPEFKRIMKPGAKGFFADSFGENKAYHIFHNKEAMQRLGDVTLTKQLIENYFKEFDLKLIPCDWFSMLDKVYEKVLPKKVARKIGSVHYKLDRLIPTESRASVFFSGSVITKISKTN